MKKLAIILTMLIASCEKEEIVFIKGRPLFYRLAVYDLDGSVNYSKTLYIKSVEILSDNGKGNGHSDKCLPLFYKYIEIQKINNRAVLRWETSYEQNLDKFAVERSFDALNFVPIGVVKPRGANVAYTYID